MLYGVLNLSFWGYVVATLILVQITIAGVTIFLHRHQAHRALDLHPIVSHFFRFWLWLTTGMVTKAWVSIHRKHHAGCETEEDPHSPIVLGIRKVLFQGAELYRQASSKPEIMEKYGHGTPDDWIERNLYTRHSALGITILFFLDLILFGLPGITIWAVQMMWIPFWAAGVINGAAHYWGYRNFECNDASTNLWPIAFFIGGEELHNNHHTFGSSAKFSVKWWEFDIGWMYIKILSFFGLAKVRKVSPKLIEQENKSTIDTATIKAIFANRFRVMANYYNDVVAPVYKEEKRKASAENRCVFKHGGKLLVREQMLMDNQDKQSLRDLLSQTQSLQTVYDLRLKLQSLWSQAATSQTELVEALQLWVKQAEATGIESLRVFATRLKSYV